MHRYFRGFAPLVLLAVFGLGLAQAQPAVQPTVDITKVPAAAQPSANFNTDAATEAYMAMIPPAAYARSNAYFEGGYWLILWGFLYGSAISLLLLTTRWSAKMRDLAVRITRFKFLQSLVYWVEYLLVTTVLGFPLEYYQNFVREHQYGLATQTFGPWMGDECKGLLVGLVFGGIAVAGIYLIVRKLPNTWWIWGSVATLAFTIFTAAIDPVFVQPLFNNIHRLDDPKITVPILKMAHANGIPANDVYEIDASRQSTRISANVSGFANTMRITLNDNLLRRASPEEIQATMGHEMGHYVLNHVAKSMVFLVVVVVLFFAYLLWGMRWALRRWGDRWGIHDVADPAGLPLALLLAGVFFFVLTPVFNTETRTQEKEADMFGINASRQPDGEAQSDIHLGEYRKMRPGPIEEFIFFDHPSGYNRIRTAMQWKSENLELFEKPPAAPAVR